MGERRGAAMARQWAAAVIAVAGCTWLSTLAPAAASGDGVAAGVPVRAEVRSRPKPPPPPPPPPPVDCGVRRCVALTFDDGPARSTSTLLDTLAGHRVRATFFLLGQNAAANPDLVRRERADGHELANHSYTHADLGKASTSMITSELTRTQGAIHRVAGVRPTLMRPPYGSTGARLTAATKRLKLAQVLWAVDPLDWQNRNSKAVERTVVRATKPGSIVLMHDIHPTTVAAVPAILRRLAAKGYTFVTVSELFGKPLTPGKKYVERDAPAPARETSVPAPGGDPAR